MKQTPWCMPWPHLDLCFPHYYISLIYRQPQLNTVSLSTSNISREDFYCYLILFWMNLLKTQVHALFYWKTNKSDLITLWAVEPISNLWRSLIFLSICSIIWTLTGSSLPKYMNCWLKQQLFTFIQDTISCTIPHDISVNTLDSRS